MNLFTVILILLVAAEHLYIMFLETFATTSRHTSKTFNIDVDELSNHHISTLLKNQGVYNGLLAVALSFAAINQDLLYFSTGGFHEKNFENYTLYHIDHGSIASCGIRSRSF